MTLPQTPQVQDKVKGANYLTPQALLSSLLLKSETSILSGVLSNVPCLLLIAPLKELSNQSTCLHRHSWVRCYQHLPKELQ